MKSFIKFAVGDPMGTAQDGPIPFIKVELDKNSDDPRDVLLCSMFQGGISHFNVFFDNAHTSPEAPANTKIVLLPVKDYATPNDWKVGRSIKFYPALNDEPCYSNRTKEFEEKQLIWIPGIITRDWGGCVNLIVFPDNSQPIVRTSVPQRPEGTTGAFQFEFS